MFKIINKFIQRLQNTTDWRTLISQRSCKIVGSCGSGKTSKLLAEAWRGSKYAHKIAVVRKNETLEWTTEKRLSLTIENIDNVMASFSAEEHSIIFEFCVFDDKDTIQTAIEYLATQLIAKYKKQSTVKVFLLLDSFEFYVNTTMIAIADSSNQQIIPCFAYQSISQISKKCGFEDFKTDASFFMRLPDNHSNSFVCEKMLGLISPAELNKLKTGMFFCHTDGKLYRGSSDLNKMVKI